MSTSAEDIFRKTLEEIAASGDVRAQLALSLAPTSLNIAQMKSDISDMVQLANENLQNAITANGDQWTNRTDQHIYAAQQKILKILSIIAR